MIRVLVVESVTWMGDLLSDVLSSAPEVMITARASNVDGALKSVNKSDVVLVNTALAHDNAMERIKEANPHARLVALDLAGDEPDRVRCLEMSVSGCVGKEDSVKDLLTLVRAARQRPGSRLPRMASAIISHVSRRAEEMGLWGKSGEAFHFRVTRRRLFARKQPTILLKRCADNGSPRSAECYVYTED